MSTLAANNITDAAGTGGPTLANGLTIGTSVLAAPSGSAPSYTCRAWVNFNGTGTVAIREDGNVSSITDNGTGDYTVNFTTAMPDANYCIEVATGRDNNTNEAITNYRPDGVATGSIRVMSQNRLAVLTDPLSFSVAIFR